MNRLQQRKLAFAEVDNSQKWPQEKVLEGVTEQRNIRFSDYVIYNSAGTVNHQNSVNALQTAEGGTTNWSAAQGPFTYDYDESAGEFVTDANGNHTVLMRYPAVGFNADGMVLAYGSLKKYGVSKYPGADMRGSYYWDTIQAEAIKVTLRLENEYSAFQITLKDAEDGTEMNISYGNTFVFSNTYAKHQFGHRRNWEDVTAWEYYPGELEVGVFYDFILKKQANRMVLYCKKESDTYYKQIWSFKPMTYDGTTNLLQIQANPSSDIVLANRDLSNDGVIDNVGRVTKTVSRVTLKELAVYAR